MLKLTEILKTNSESDDVVCLPFAARQKSRQPVVTNKGVTVGVFLPRGQMLHAGVVLTGSQGFRLRVDAALEDLSVVCCEDPLLLARACYHLGNRHIAVQILPGELRYLADHVLDAMLEGLGLAAQHQHLPFEPESGAYQSHGH